MEEKGRISNRTRKKMERYYTIGGRVEYTIERDKERGGEEERKRKRKIGKKKIGASPDTNRFESSSQLLQTSVLPCLYCIRKNDGNVPKKSSHRMHYDTPIVSRKSTQFYRGNARNSLETD